MILIGLGANLPSPEHGPPRATLAAALEALQARGARVLRRSPWYESAPVPPSGQPWYVNAVAEVESGLSPPALLDALLAVEAGFGRVRGARNASRSVDLDLLDYGGLVTGPDEKPELPHPRLHERAFVLLPLARHRARLAPSGLGPDGGGADRSPRPARPDPAAALAPPKRRCRACGIGLDSRLLQPSPAARREFRPLPLAFESSASRGRAGFQHQRMDGPRSCSTISRRPKRSRISRK